MPAVTRARMPFSYGARLTARTVFVFKNIVFFSGFYDNIYIELSKTSVPVRCPTDYLKISGKH